MGDRARALYAHREAIRYYHQALEVLKESGDLERAARTLMKLGLTYHNGFDFKASHQAYEEGFLLWQRSGKTEPTTPSTSAPHAPRVTARESPTLDPGLALDISSLAIIDQLFSGLVQLTAEMGVVPDVARGWEVLDGGRKYVFRLRNDVRWTDGVPVTAGDFEYAWKRVLDPGGRASLVSLMYDLRGARAYHQGEVPDPSDVGVRAPDDATLIAELEGPTSYFPYLLANAAAFPVPRHMIQAHGESWTDLGNIVTNGPFRLAAWERGKSMLLERSAFYHGRSTGNLQQVALTFHADRPDNVLRAYGDDGLDVLDLRLLPQETRTRARQWHAEDYISAPGLGIGYIGFDVNRPPLNDHQVRRAFTLATDRETLADVALRGNAFPATGGFVPPGIPGHSSSIGLPYDPEEAQRLLRDAGYPGGHGFPALEALIENRPSAILRAEYVKAQWRENLGIEITWEKMEWGNLLDRLQRQSPHMWHMGYMADYPDPDNFLRTCEWRQTGGWQHRAFDQLVEEARKVTDQKARIGMYEQAPILPLGYGRWQLLVKPWVRIYPTSPTRNWFWKDVIIEQH